MLTELPAGQITEFLGGFTNKGNQEMMLESVEAAFHYPMDHSFVIQNFSAFSYAKIVKPQQQATVLYSFIPSEHFAGRPFGLSINLAYRDMVSVIQFFLSFQMFLFLQSNFYNTLHFFFFQEGRVYSEAVFNETVNIFEVDEGFDGETFFLYLFFAAGSVLLLVLGQQALASMGKRRGGSSSR